jgi:acyl-CoA dehydrogenase
MKERRREIDERLMEKARRISVDVASANAAAVDRESRFPVEVFDALKRERLLGALVPEAFGGHGCRLPILAEICRAIGEGCASSGLILAMHYSQVASIARHATQSPFFQTYLRELADKQELIASVTSEVGIGGDMRSSICAVESRDGRLTLNKSSTSISYGAHADALLVTARRAPDAAANDQVLVLLRRPDYSLEVTGKWDTLGMRGTCSPPFRLSAALEERQILPEAFSVITEQTMVPFSHVLWGGCWLGIAGAAVAKARAFVRAQARRNPGATLPGGVRLAEAAADLQLMRDAVGDAARLCDDLMSTPEGAQELASMGVMIRLNNLKISSSQLVVQTIGRAMAVCGIAGYRQDTPFSLGRHLRDAHSAALMINNDRIYQTNASLLQVHKDD